MSIAVFYGMFGEHAVSRRRLRVIISASRRTDIPRFFMDWMLNRLKEGYALVRNPMCRTQVSRVALGAGAVDCLAFWTKDPTPLLAQAARLESAAPAPYFVQFTLNAYGADVEAGLPRKAELVETRSLPTFSDPSAWCGATARSCSAAPAVATPKGTTCATSRRSPVSWRVPRARAG